MSDRDTMGLRALLVRANLTVGADEEFSATLAYGGQTGTFTTTAATNTHQVARNLEELAVALDLIAFRNGANVTLLGLGSGFGDIALSTTGKGDVLSWSAHQTTLNVAGCKRGDKSVGVAVMAAIADPVVTKPVNTSHVR